VANRHKSGTLSWWTKVAC